jgi:hypothetical protein
MIEVKAANEYNRRCYEKQSSIKYCRHASEYTQNME